jgi:DNA-binding transcriptional ArsR family regulator
MGKLADKMAAGEITPQEAMVKALGHPLRVRILVLLTERTASPNEMQELLDEPLGNCAYHTRVLEELGHAEIVSEVQRRGATEHYYRSINRPLVDDHQWESFEPKVRQAISAFGIDAIFKDAAEALRTGTFDARTERHLSRTPLLLDEEGWREANTIQNEALDALLEVQAKSAERMTKSKEQGIPALAAMACFERTLPEPDSQAR